MTKESKNKGVLNKVPLNGIEHALHMYTTSYCTMPVEYIYDKRALNSMIDVIEKCHIYMIGLQPKISLLGAEQDKNHVSFKFSILDVEYTTERNDVPDGYMLKQDENYGWHFSNERGERFNIAPVLVQNQLSRESNAVTFDVKYIGQAYGTNGSRNAIDRLLKHEKLQEISLKGIPDGYQLILLLLEVQPNNQMITLFQPNAKIKDDDSRIRSGLDKLFGTSYQEQISLYEAAFIRYFSPQFNREFKNSFPSTNLQILQECYEKDFAAIIAEICIDPRQ